MVFSKYPNFEILIKIATNTGSLMEMPDYATERSSQRERELHSFLMTEATLSQRH